MNGHRIEEAAKVYLVLSADGTHWELDPVTLDGHPLDGYEHGPLNEACDCRDPAECRTALAAAQHAHLPTAAQIARMLTQHPHRDPGPPATQQHPTDHNPGHPTP